MDQNDDRDPSEHLVPHRFPKGRSGNPGGRPKGSSISAKLKAILAQDHNGKEIGDILAEQLVKEGLQGKLAHIKEILDRTEGRAPVTGEIALTGVSDSLFIIHVPGPEVIGYEAHALAIKEVEEHAPPGAKVLVGKWWMAV